MTENNRQKTHTPIPPQKRDPEPPSDSCLPATARHLHPSAGLNVFYLSNVLKQSIHAEENRIAAVWDCTAVRANPLASTAALIRARAGPGPSLKPGKPPAPAPPHLGPAPPAGAPQGPPALAAARPLAAARDPPLRRDFHPQPHGCRACAPPAYGPAEAAA